MKAAIHVGHNFNENLEVHRKPNFEELQNLFHITQKLILHHEVEILKVKAIEWTSHSWTRSTLSHNQVIKWTKVRVRVYSVSVLCLGEMSDHEVVNRRWEGQVKSFQQSDSYRELFGVYGEPMGFERNLFLGLTSLEIRQRIQKDSQDQNIEPETFEQRKETQNNVFQIRNKSRITRRDSRTLDVHWAWRGKEMVWNSHSSALEGKWDACHTHGVAIQGIGSSSIQEHQCFGS